MAKYCLNQAILSRLRCGRTGRGAIKDFTLLDFITAKKNAGMVDWAAHPWDKKEYKGISDQGVKLYRGLILPEKRNPDKVDGCRTRPADSTQDVQPVTAQCLWALRLGFALFII